MSVEAGPRWSAHPAATPPDDLGYPHDAAMRLRNAARALTPTQRRRLAAPGDRSCWWLATCDELRIGFTANALRVLSGAAVGDGDHDDQAVFAGQLRALTDATTGALVDRCRTAAERAHGAGEAAIGAVLDALADFIEAARSG